MSRLSNIPLFANLNHEDLVRIEARASEKTYPKGTVIIREGDPGEAMYLLLSGKIKVFVSDQQGKEFVLAVLGAGEYVGEFALLDDEKRTASVETEEPSTFLILHKQDFVALLGEYPEMQMALLRNLIGRVRNLTESVKNLALKDVYGRVRVLIESMCEEKDGLVQLKEQLTQQAIADRVGSSREMIARIMKELMFGGYIRVENRKMIILNRLPEHF